MTWPTSQETQELLASAKAGQRAAVNALLDRHRQALRRMVTLRMDPMLGRRIDASDVVQDVLVEANGRLQDYLAEPRMPFSLWLRSLAKDRLIDLYRQHRGAQRRSMDRELPLAAPGLNDQSSLDLAAQLLDRELTPAAAMIQRELEQRFLIALNKLEEDDKDLILMRHFEQLGNGEVAELLGLSPAAAGMRHLRVLRKLRTLLGTETESSLGETDSAS